jgi:ParB/RepB/Spo0J family partition protein
MKVIKLEEIVNDDNRKHARDGDFEQLVNSIRRHGVIEPPVVRKLKEGGYRIVAGRRRVAAMRQLKMAEALCVIRDEDGCDDSEIALAENVNRLAMHPLDETAAFAGMADRGATVKEIAQYYARSPSDIYKRLRLVSLAGELKGMFRDGKLDIAGAAVLAELPEEDQKDFFLQYEKKNGAIETGDIYGFVQKKQRYKIREHMKEGCAGCAKRTHNDGNELFEEYEHLDDMCLDGACYYAKWYDMIAAELDKKIRTEPAADNKIYFSGGVPELMYKKKNVANFTIGGKNTEFEILRSKDYEFTGESKKKKDACWQIHEAYGGDLHIVRVCYAQKTPAEKPAAKSGAAVKDDKVKEYGREALAAAAADRGTAAKDLADELHKKIRPYDFKKEVAKIVFDRTVFNRIEAEKTAGKPLCDYFTLLLKYFDDNFYGKWLDKDLDAEHKRLVEALTGKKSLKEAAAGLPDETQRLFHYLFLNIMTENDCNVPELDDLKYLEKGKNENFFWEYAMTTAEEYKALYLQAAKEAAAAALDKTEKKGGKKDAAAKRGGKKTADDDDHGGADEEDAEDGYPFSPGEDTDTEEDVYAETDES